MKVLIALLGGAMTLAPCVAIAASPGKAPPALTALSSKEASDIAAVNIAISALQAPQCNNAGVCTLKGPGGKTFTINGTLVAGGAPTLVADGTPAVTMNGSTFAWMNQPSGATVSGGDNSGTTAETDISAQPHIAPANQAAIGAKMLASGSVLTAACYRELLYVTDPADGYYNSGMFLRSPATANNITFYNEGAAPAGANVGVQLETNYASGGASSLGGGYDNGYPIAQQYYQEFCTDGTNGTFYKSQTGAAGSFVQIATGTLASMGSPTDIGYFEDAFAQTAPGGNPAQTYVGVSHLVSFQITTGNTPQAVAQIVVPTFANEIVTSTFPTAADPMDITAKPSGWPSGDTANLSNYASFVFGSANTMSPNCSACLISTRAQLDTHFEHNQLAGNAYTNVDTGPKDGFSNSAYVSIFRTYPSGDAHDTTVLNSDALQIRAFCSGLNGTTCQGKGNVVSGIVRPETVVQDDTVVEACMIRPSTQAAWLTFWDVGGTFPAAGSTPVFYGSSVYPTLTTNYLENDGPDGYPLSDGVAGNFDLTPQIPTLTSSNSTLQNVSVFYSANGAPFSHVSGGYHTTYDQSAAMHCYQYEHVPPVYTDNTHSAVTTPGHIIYSVDGVEYQDSQTNWVGGPQTSWNGITLTGNPTPQSSVMVALQYGATFDPNSVATMTPANVAGAVAKLYSLRFWHRTGGSHAPPTLPAG